MKWLIRPIKAEHEKIKLLTQMLTVAELPFDFVYTEKGIIYNEKKEVYHLNDNELYFVCGSYQLAQVVHKTHPEAVFLLDNYTFKDWYHIFGKDNMLNPDVQIAYPKDIKWTHEEMFVRPTIDSKAFNGGIYNAQTLKTEVECVVAPLQHIQKEFRFFVLNGEIIGASQYKMNGQLFVSSIVDQDAIDFATQMIDKFDFPGFVIDIASTNGQCKVVELNCFNASGFYQIDLWKFVDKIMIYYENLTQNKTENLQYTMKK